MAGGEEIPPVLVYLLGNEDASPGARMSVFSPKPGERHDEN